MAALKHIVGAGGTVPPPQQVLLSRQVDNGVHMSVHVLLGVKYGSHAARVSSRGGQLRGKIVRLRGKVDQQVWSFTVL